MQTRRLAWCGHCQSSFPNDSVCSESSVAAAGSVVRVVAAQLASRVRASWVGDPGSGVQVRRLAEIGSQRKGLVGQVEVSDDRVVDQLDAVGVDLDVVGCPSATELVAAGRQRIDQIGEAPVVGVASGLVSRPRSRGRVAPLTGPARGAARRGAWVVPAARIRSTRWVRSASSSWSARDAVDDALGDAGGVAALELGVVLARDARQEGNLVAAQARDPSTLSAIGVQPRLLRGDPGPSRGQKRLDLPANAAAGLARDAGPRVGVPPFTRPLPNRLGR